MSEPYAIWQPQPEPAPAVVRPVAALEGGGGAYRTADARPMLPVRFDRDGGVSVFCAQSATRPDSATPAPNLEDGATVHMFGPNVALCGMMPPPRWSDNEEDVTCLGCLREAIRAERSEAEQAVRAFGRGA